MIVNLVNCNISNASEKVCLQQTGVNKLFENVSGQGLIQNFFFFGGVSNFDFDILNIFFSAELL